MTLSLRVDRRAVSHWLGLNKRRRMADEGTSKSKRDNLTGIDVGFRWQARGGFTWR